MLTVRELFSSVAWRDVSDVLVEAYSINRSELSSFKAAFDAIRAIDAVPNVDGTVVHVEPPEAKDEICWVYCTEGKNTDEEHIYGLDYVLFSEVANFWVDEDVFKFYSKEEAVAHILWEITWYGFTEEDILTAREELERRVNNINPEECIPWQEVVRKLEAEQDIEGEE